MSTALNNARDVQRPVYIVAELKDAYTDQHHRDCDVWYLYGESDTTGLPLVRADPRADSEHFEVVPEQSGKTGSTVSVQLKGLVKGGKNNATLDPVNGFRNLK